MEKIQGGLAGEQPDTRRRYTVGVTLDYADRLGPLLPARNAFDQRLDRDSHVDVLPKDASMVSPSFGVSLGQLAPGSGHSL